MRRTGNKLPKNSTIALFDKTHFRTVELGSPTEQRNLTRVLGQEWIPSHDVLLRELAIALNPVSFRKVIRSMLGAGLNHTCTNTGSSFLSAFRSDPIYDLPPQSYLSVVVENLNYHSATAGLTVAMLDQYFGRVSHQTGSIIEPISRMIASCGYSRIALLKLFQLEVLSVKLSEADAHLRQTLYGDGSVRDLGDILMIVDQTIQPRGRPFRTMLSYSQKIDFGADFYTSIAEEVCDSFCPFPIMEEQVDDFLRILSGFTISDQAVGLRGLYRIARARNWEIARKIRVSAEDPLRFILDSDHQPGEENKFFTSLLGSNFSDYDVYNAATANRDLSIASLFRNYADEILLPKISSVTKAPAPQPGQKHLRMEKKANLSDQTLAPSSLTCPICDTKGHALSYLLRFLNFRRLWPVDFEFSAASLSTVVESGMPLHRILTDDEIEKMVLCAPLPERNLAILILRHFPTIREYSEDSDYLFLRALEVAAIQESDGDIVAYIDRLSAKYPKLAVNLINTLTPRRLQKCYMCISNYPQVSLSHRKLLEVAARTTGDIDLIIQADQIALDEKLAVARAQFDSSRIFVDEVLFRNWSLEEIVPSLLALRKHVFLYSPGLPENATVEEITASVKTGALAKIAGILKEHFSNLPIREAFRRFCLDHYFGVDSFLGRRIRHNATHGVLLGQMEKLCVAAIEKDPHESDELHDSFYAWRAEFLHAVNALVADRFRFRTDEFPKGLLHLAYEASLEKFDQLETDLIIHTIASSKPETIVQSMINGFWGLLKPELKRVRTFLRTEFKQHALEILEAHFHDKSGPVVGLAADIRSTLLERIERLSSWYTPYSPAEITIGLADIAQMVWADVEDFRGKPQLVIGGNAQELLVTGGNVRTLFDCLHVVLVNASKHAIGGFEVTLEFIAANPKEVGVQDLLVRIASSLSDTKADRERSELHFQRMRGVLQGGEINERAMVIQGYSGLPKLKYLLFRTQRPDSLSLEWNKGKVTIGFSIPINFPSRQDDVGID